MVEPVVEALGSSLTALVNLAHSFIDAVFVPFDTFEPILTTLIQDGTSNIATQAQENWQEIVKANGGFLACLVIAILYIVGCVIGGLIWCLCHCFCTTKKQTPEQAQSICRISHLFFTITAGIFVLISAIFIFLSNQGVYNYLPEVPSDIVEIITVAENSLTQIATGIISTVTAVVYTLLANVSTSVLNIGDTFAKPIIDDIKVTLDQPLTDLKALPDKITNLESSLETVNSNIFSLKAQQGLVVTEVNDVFTQLEADTDPSQTC